MIQQPEIIPMPGKRRMEYRSVYRQTNGDLILGDECICHDSDWRWDCPIEVHAIAARMQEMRKEDLPARC